MGKKYVYKLELLLDSIRIILEDRTKILFIPKVNHLVIALPRKKFTDELCVKKIDGEDYFTFTFDGNETQAIFDGISKSDLVERTNKTKPNSPEREAILKELFGEAEIEKK